MTFSKLMTVRTLGLLVGLVLGCSSSLPPGTTGGTGGSPVGTGGGSGGIPLSQDGGSPGWTGGAGGAAGHPPGGPDAGPDGGVCPNYHVDGEPTYGVCCPDPPPDCLDRPDGAAGVPGLTNPDGSAVLVCIDRRNGYCSCSCSNGQWWCAC